MEVNRDNMESPWNTQSRLQVLKARFDDGAAFAAFANQHTPATNVLNIPLVVILVMGVFQLEYSEWHFFSDNKKIIDNTWIWWAEKIQIRLKFSMIDGNMVRAS
jgi:hypothetical protein